MREAARLSYDGKIYTIREWANELGISHWVLRQRLQSGWSVQKAIETPVLPVKRKRTSHGMSGSKEYCAWQNMKFRCENPKNNRWHRYGARGISVCERWRKCFTTFYQDVGPAPSPEHSLGRLDHDRNYEPGNVAWQSPEEQVTCWCKNNGSMTRRK